MRSLGSRLAAVDIRTAKPAAKEVDPFYLTPQYRAWRDEVIRRACGRCEVIERGARCAKAAPRYRMFAHHKVERSDGGDPLDPANGECRCGSHHSSVTAANRARRMGATLPG